MFEIFLQTFVDRISWILGAYVTSLVLFFVWLKAIDLYDGVVPSWASTRFELFNSTVVFLLKFFGQYFTPPIYLIVLVICFFRGGWVWGFGEIIFWIIEVGFSLVVGLVVYVFLGMITMKFSDQLRRWLHLAAGMISILFFTTINLVASLIMA